MTEKNSIKIRSNILTTGNIFNINAKNAVTIIIKSRQHFLLNGYLCVWAVQPSR